MLVSKTTKAVWCQANHCTKEELNYWLSKMKPNPSLASQTSTPSIFPLAVSPPRPSSPLLVQIREIEIT